MAQPSQPPTGLPLLALGHVFFRIGATAFGGLETYLALIERELVTKRQWLTAADMTEALIYTKLLPGSTGPQVVAYLGYIDSAFFIQVDRLAQAAQMHAEQAQFSAYYRFSIFANAFVVLSGVFAFRMGGATSAQVLKLGCSGILVLVSGLNDLTMWAMYDWPDGVRPETFEWASHVSIFLGRDPRVLDMLAFASVHLLLIVGILRVPLERWIPNR